MVKNVTVTMPLQEYTELVARMEDLMKLKDFVEEVGQLVYEEGGHCKPKARSVEYLCTKARNLLGYSSHR